MNMAGVRCYAREASKKSKMKNTKSLPSGSSKSNKVAEDLPNLGVGKDLVEKHRTSNHKRQRLINCGLLNNFFDQKRTKES